MANQWLFKSETYDNCNCAVNCGCQFNLPSTHGYCQSAFVGHLVAGHFNETPLAGLKWAALYKWPGEIAAGKGKRQIIIDERADEAQRVALATIISGEACKPLRGRMAPSGARPSTGPEKRSAPRAGQRLAGVVARRWRPPARSLRGRDRRG